MPITQSFNEGEYKININIKATLKASKVGQCACGPAGLAVFSCGIRLTPLEAVTDSCPCQKAQRNQALVLLVNKRFIQQRYQFSHRLLLGPFGTTHSYSDNSVSIGPTSVSHYKWTLSKHPSVHAKQQVHIFNCC